MRDQTLVPFANVLSLLASKLNFSGRHANHHGINIWPTTMLDAYTDLRTYICFVVATSSLRTAMTFEEHISRTG